MRGFKPSVHSPLCLFSSLTKWISPHQEPFHLPSCRASLWSSCVVLPLLALTWMSAVLAITDRRSALFQILFAVFDSLEGFVIVMVHCILRREVRFASPVKTGLSGFTLCITFFCYTSRSTAIRHTKMFQSHNDTAHSN